MSLNRGLIPIVNEVLQEIDFGRHKAYVEAIYARKANEQERKHGEVYSLYHFLSEREGNQTFAQLQDIFKSLPIQFHFSDPLNPEREYFIDPAPPLGTYKRVYGGVFRNERGPHAATLLRGILSLYKNEVLDEEVGPVNPERPTIGVPAAVPVPALPGKKRKSSAQIRNDIEKRLKKR